MFHSCHLSPTSSKSFHDTIEITKNTYDSDIEVRVNTDKELLWVFIQDPAMKKSFESYPDVIFVDSTYKLLDINLPLFVIMVENRNGESLVAAVGLLMKTKKPLNGSIKH